VCGVRASLYAVVAWGLVSAALPRVTAADGDAEVVAFTVARDQAGERIGDDASGLRAGREERVLRQRLRELGVSAGDTDAVLARLTPDERSELATRAPELAAGGNAAAPVLAVAIIIGLLVILVLELMGRRVVSRPAP